MGGNRFVTDGHVAFTVISQVSDRSPDPGALDWAEQLIDGYGGRSEQVDDTVDGIIQENTPLDLSDEAMQRLESLPLEVREQILGALRRDTPPSPPAGRSPNDPNDPNDPNAQDPLALHDDRAPVPTIMSEMLRLQELRTASKLESPGSIKPNRFIRIAQLESPAVELLERHKLSGEPLSIEEVQQIVDDGAASVQEFEMVGGGLYAYRGEEQPGMEQPQQGGMNELLDSLDVNASEDQCKKCKGTGTYAKGRFQENPGICYECMGTGRSSNSKMAQTQTQFLHGDQYPWLCEECRSKVDEIAQLYEEGIMPDEDDPEAPVNFIYDHRLFCGGHECVEKPVQGPEPPIDHERMDREHDEMMGFSSSNPEIRTASLDDLVEYLNQGKQQERSQQQNPYAPLFQNELKHKREVERRRRGVDTMGIETLKHQLGEEKTDDRNNLNKLLAWIHNYGNDQMTQEASSNLGMMREAQLSPIPPDYMNKLRRSVQTIHENEKSGLIPPLENRTLLDSAWDNPIYRYLNPIGWLNKSSDKMSVNKVMDRNQMWDPHIRSWRKKTEDEIKNYRDVPLETQLSSNASSNSKFIKLSFDLDPDEFDEERRRPSRRIDKSIPPMGNGIDKSIGYDRQIDNSDYQQIDKSIGMGGDGIDFSDSTQIDESIGSPGGHEPEQGGYSPVHMDEQYLILQNKASGDMDLFYRSDDQSEYTIRIGGKGYVFAKQLRDPRELEAIMGAGRNELKASAMSREASAITNFLKRLFPPKNPGRMRLKQMIEDDAARKLMNQPPPKRMGFDLNTPPNLSPGSKMNLPIKFNDHYSNPDIPKGPR